MARGEAESGRHRQAWKPFTDELLRLLNVHPLPIVFMLWGREALKKKVHIAGHHHLVVKASHPAARGKAQTFKDSRPFSQANAFLDDRGRGTIDWRMLGASDH